MPERAVRGLRRAAAVAVVFLVLEGIALVALAFDVRAVAVGIFACAGLALAAFYGAYEGFDAILRRPR